MKMGDIVLYKENGEVFVATVLSSRELEDHSGQNEEPLVSLGFFAPVTRFTGTGKAEKKSVIGTQAQHEHAQFRLDVAHASHGFTKQENKRQHPNGYPGGRWIHAEVVPASEDQDTELVVSEDETIN